MSESGQQIHPDLDRLVTQLRGDLFVRWMKQAQKAALIEWRDRTEAPGLAARFTKTGDGFYNFTPRTKKYNRRKGGLPDFVYTTGLREMIKSREPKSLNNGNVEAITRIKFGGGALNFLTAVKKMVGFSITVLASKTHIKAYFRKGKSVRGYEGTRKRRRINKQLGAVSYADEYGRLDKDIPWLRAKVLENFNRIFRRAALTKRGTLKSNTYGPVGADE